MKKKEYHLESCSESMQIKIVKTRVLFQAPPPLSTLKIFRLRSIHICDRSVEVGLVQAIYYYFFF